MFDECLSLYRQILEFEHKFLPGIHRSIDQFFVPRMTKIWPKTARQNFVSMQNRGTRSTKVCLSIDEFWNLKKNFFHAKPWKTKHFRQNIQFKW